MQDAGEGFELHTEGPAGVVVARLLDKKGISHGFATRLGGVTEGPCASLTFGSGGQTERQLRTNLERLGLRLGFDMTRLYRVRQVHSADVLVIERAGVDTAGVASQEADALVAATEEFVTAYKAGEDRLARTLYPEARTHWERIETVAESFADLDPILDAREADVAPGEKWTGWHRLEKDLWPARAEKYLALTPRQRASYADDLLANTRTLEERIGGLTFTVDQIANGATGLLEEVATGKVTGEEEYWSRTDLWDFQANIDGAHEAFELLEPIIAEHDADLEDTLDERFAAVQALLDQHRKGDGFVSYDELSEAEVKQLAGAVNALAEPLSKISAAVV